MKILYRVLLGTIFIAHFLVSCKQPKPVGDSERGITSDLMPPNIRALYDNSRGGDSAYYSEARDLYFKYLNKGQRDSALFCLIAFNEVLDQNYIYDSLVLFWTKDHLAKGLGTSENQNELLKLGYYIGSMYFTIEDADSSFYWLYFTLNHPATLPRTRVKCRSMLANCYSNLNQMDSSIALKQANIEYYASRKDTTNFCVSSSNLGSDYRYIHAYNLAADYTREALRLAQLKKDTFTEIMLRHNMGLIYAEDDGSPKDIAENVYRLNFLMDHYSKKNLNMEYSQAISNIQYHGILKQLDSMGLWLNRFKTICEIQKGSSYTMYLNYAGLYENYTKKPLSNPDFLKMNAFKTRNEGEYSQAISSYNVLFNSARNSGNFGLALAYQDTLYDLQQLLYRRNFDGKIYEMDVKYKNKLKEQELLLKDQELLSRNRTLVLLFALVVILILLFVVYFFWQKERSTRLMKANEERYSQLLLENTEEERMRIARDLHDSVGHELLNLKGLIASNSEKGLGQVEAILKEVREISRNLFPAMFEEVGLTLSILQLTDTIQKSENFYISTELEYSKGLLPLKWELNIYRIIQESLSNTLKYAEAKSAKIDLVHSENQVKLLIQDNGKGFNLQSVTSSGKAFGLMSMRQRCNAMGAQLKIESGEKGTRIEILVPIPNQG